MKDSDGPCECCGSPGKFAQAPWPLPISTCHCNDCAALESIAYSVWREFTPITVSKQNAPIPFLKSKADYPPESLKRPKRPKLEDYPRWGRCTPASAITQEMRDERDAILARNKVISDAYEMEVKGQVAALREWFRKKHFGLIPRT